MLALLVCGLAELSFRRLERGDAPAMSSALPAFVLAATTGAAALPDLAWTALKVGGLSYGGGFVIVPIMQGDAVDRFGWMTNSEFLNAVALGQITPGPVTQTVAVVGYAAAGSAGALLASAVAFAPSFALILLGGRRFLALRENLDARAFLDGAGPAAVGAIFGAFVPLAGGVDLAWQWAVAAAAAVLLLGLRRGHRARDPRRGGRRRARRRRGRAASLNAAAAAAGYCAAWTACSSRRPTSPSRSRAPRPRSRRARRRSRRGCARATLDEVVGQEPPARRGHGAARRDRAATARTR